jgi:hypothetical protein
MCFSILAAVASVAVVQASTPSDVCTFDYVAAAIPADELLTGITFNRAAISVDGHLGQRTGLLCRRHVQLLMLFCV